ncbi:Uncharacterized protein BP5553_03806 [Venustampulla echinocandica]|uniref:Utp8 beta-propeller domain-containing protein n=1 Tax=Venustampulla echinocandica TaxID=2656787 RepID=A0A370TVB8_9HELO|nr:Uncharacterized protein BP5553_03806 [Venustampulla echinocandica]RDL39466.1 Uncharacterized protein BP5553_03806 [Venustampulla echinocandica]
MSAKFSLQTPYVVAPLPKPIDRKNGRYVVGNVYGGAPGSKKRKRSELAVGVDGESINLYDISSSRLITSYALPPQSSFTCPPSSLRTRISKHKVERRTYASTAGTQSQVTLFRDLTEGHSTKSSAASHVVKDHGNPIVFMGAVAAVSGPEVLPSASDLVVVKKDGEIQCLDGESLQSKWTSPSGAIAQDIDTGHAKDVDVEYAHLTNAYATRQGIFKGRQDVFGIFPQEISEDGFNPDLLVIISKTKETPFVRRLHVVAFPSRSSAHQGGQQRSVQPLLATKFPAASAGGPKDATAFSIQVSGGILHQLHDDILTTFDLTETGPKEQSTLIVKAAKSFLRLSSTSILVSSQNHLSVYNPKYQSILAAAGLDPVSDNEPLKRKYGEEPEANGAPERSCDLITYFPKLGAAVAIIDSNLVAMQIEGHQDRQGRNRAVGLLIDSLGCSVRNQTRSCQGKAETDKLDSQTMSEYLPSQLSKSDTPWASQIEILENAFSKRDGVAFDGLIAQKLGTKLKKLSATPVSSKKVDLNVDRRWLIYALSKIFSWGESDSGEYKLSIRFFPPKIFLWLIEAGHMTVANIESAVRSTHDLPVKPIPAGELVNAIAEINEDMDMLLGLVRNNYLGAMELLHAIRILMGSLEMLGETKQGLLTNGEDSEKASGNSDEQLEKLEAETERVLELAEYQLGPGSDVRGQALSLALSKLYTCPTSGIVYALQTTFTAHEIVCLIYLLRFELARGGWTARYLDVEHPEGDGDDAGAPNNSIILVSSLLNNCIDAVGAGGWLSGDVRLVSGDPFEAEELISSLKLEVSAALEGIEEATYLKGITSEMIRYGAAVVTALPQEPQEPKDGAPATKKRKVLKPITLPSADQDYRILPVGLKAEQQISRLKVGAGGEVYKRTARDIGNLRSRKVGKYSQERIII